MSSKLAVLCSAAIASTIIISRYLFKSFQSPSIQTKYIYIAGDRSAVGKSSICGAIIHYFVKHKILKKSEIAYIKPMTQCLKATDVARYCLSNGIDCIPIGPIIFKKGYTSSVIAEKEGTRTQRLQSIKSEIVKLSQNKRLVLIDGVGYVSVGSVCNIDNVDVAQLMDAFTVLVIRSGVGDAIDTTNLLLSYYQTKSAKYFKERMLGIIYNFKTENKGHPIEECKEYVSKYFNANRPNVKLLGWLPPMTMDGVKRPNEELPACKRNDVPNENEWKEWPKLTASESKWMNDFATNFEKNIDVNYIVSKFKL